MAFCSKCGTANDESMRFCGSCGAALPTKSPSLLTGKMAFDWSRFSVGSKISGVCSALVLLLFLFPWLDVGIANISGMRLAFQDMPRTLLFLIVPATAIGTLLVLYQGMKAKSSGKQAMKLRLVGSVLSLLVMLWLYISTKNEMGGLGGRLFTGWFWLSVLAAIAVLVGTVKEKTSSLEE